MFDDIKEGDTVLVETESSISSCFSTYMCKLFFLRKTVTKVTKTQFTLDDGTKYNKKGKRLGGVSTLLSVYPSGHERDGKVLKCQRKAFEDHQIKLRYIEKTARMLGCSVADEPFNFSNYSLVEAVEKAKLVRAALHYGKPLR